MTYSGSHKNSCSHNRDDLVLYFYDELDEGARSDIDARLAVCATCRESLSSIESISLSVPRSPSIDLSEATVAAVREATSKRLASESVSRRGKEIVIRMPVQARWSFALVAVVMAFFFGRTSVESSSLAPPPGFDLTSQALVSDIEYDFEKNEVQIQYESPTFSTISADISDARVQALLGLALLDDDNPGSRLRAARAVSEANFLNVRPDPTLIKALTSVLGAESNDGIRLQALKALNSLLVGSPVSDDVKGDLIDILLNEENSALRIEALQLLTRSELASIDLQKALQQARRDNNPFIRRQAESALTDFEQTGRLEVLAQ